MGGNHFPDMFNSILTLLAQAPAGGTAAKPYDPTSMIMMVGLCVIFYFLLIRPQTQRQKQLDALVKSVKTGDKVITSSGIHGMVSNVKETTVILKIADNVKIEMEKSSIGTVVKRDQAETASASSAS